MHQLMVYFTFCCAGIASYFYPAPMYAGMNVCAMNLLPPKTHIVIENTANNAEAPCTVIGTGPFIPGRILDVSPNVAEKLGFLNAGTAYVTIHIRHGSNR